MRWYGIAVKNMDYNKVYSSQALVCMFRSIKGSLSDSAYRWALSSLIRSGSIIKLGYDSYTVSTNVNAPKEKYVSAYTDVAKCLTTTLADKYPYVQFTVFETTLLNEFLNHLVSQNTIFLQVEKTSSIYVFRYLQECGYANVIYKPSRSDFDLYWAKDCIVINDLISESPLRKDLPHAIMLEKMLVDMLADQLIASTFSKSELPYVIEQMQRKYAIDTIKMLRYANRRNRKTEVLQYLKGVD